MSPKVHPAGAGQPGFTPRLTRDQIGFVRDPCAMDVGPLSVKIRFMFAESGMYSPMDRSISSVANAVGCTISNPSRWGDGSGQWDVKRARNSVELRADGGSWVAVAAGAVVRNVIGLDSGGRRSFDRNLQ